MLNERIPEIKPELNLTKPNFPNFLSWVMSESYTFWIAPCLKVILLELNYV